MYLAIWQFRLVNEVKYNSHCSDCTTNVQNKTVFVSMLHHMLSIWEELNKTKCTISYCTTQSTLTRIHPTTVSSLRILLQTSVVFYYTHFSHCVHICLQMIHLLAIGSQKNLEKKSTVIIVAYSTSINRRRETNLLLA